jgi:hypothetical protein
VSSLPHPNGVDFPSQLTTPFNENVKAIITQSGKTTTEPKTSSKKTTPIELNEEGSEAEAEVEAEMRLEKELTLGKLLPRTLVIRICCHFLTK